MKCVICKRKLGSNNKSGYCSKDYKHSPQYLEYQRKAQGDYHKTKRRKGWLKKYQNTFKFKEHTKEYQKKYRANNVEKIREYKKEQRRIGGKNEFRTIFF